MNFRPDKSEVSPEFENSVGFIPAGVNSFPRCQSGRAVKHTSDHNLYPVLSDQSRGC